MVMRTKWVIYLDIVTLFGYLNGTSRNCDSLPGSLRGIGALLFCCAQSAAMDGRQVLARNSKRQVKIPAHAKEGEKDVLTRHWQKHFLDHLAQSSNVTESAKVAGINPSRAYLVRRQDAAFARQWLAALWEGYLHLEMEVLRRLREGDNSAGEKDKYDFANAIRLLNAHRDNAARAQAEHRNVSAAEIRASIDKKVETIRLEVQREKLRKAGRA